MFIQQVPTANQQLDGIIAEILTQMSGADCGTEEYARMADQLVKLYKAKETDSKIQVSEFDALGKHNQIEAEIIQKEIDTQHRHDEAITASRLREEELGLKQQEIDATCTLKAAETELKMKESKYLRHVSADALAVVAANLTGIVLIIGYERINVITSKALGFVSKLR